MATDVDVQFFSHLNGLTLSNNWGDMIRLLDACLVNGLPLTSITSATVDAQGDINLTLFAAHNCLLFQIVELSGFAPSGFNGKYRIKGTPTATTLILKADKTGQTITTTGTAKLAPLGYEIKFRDLNDVKRAYRAIDPTDAHPFIRVDESLSGEGGGTYTSTYAKSAMVGLIENMTHIDDYADTSKLQLPLDTADFSKNWKIVGTGTSVVRGWSKWYWRVAGIYNDYFQESGSPPNTNANFTICGNKDAFYLMPAAYGQVQKQLYGAGVYGATLDNIKPYFLFSALDLSDASNSKQIGALTGSSPLSIYGLAGQFFVLKNTVSVDNHVLSTGIMPNFQSGESTIFAATDVPALDIPFYDNDSILRGTLHHIKYMGRPVDSSDTTPIYANGSMLIKDNVRLQANNQVGRTGAFYFYLGELE